MTRGRCRALRCYCPKFTHAITLPVARGGWAYCTCNHTENVHEIVMKG